MNAAVHPASRKRIPPPIGIAAADNLSPEFFKTLSALGLEILIVSFEASKSYSAIFGHAGIEYELDKELQAIKAGQFDSSYFTRAAHCHLFHVPASALGKAMKCVKDALAARGLLESATLFHAESATEWRVWHPATAALLNTDADTDT